MIQPSRPDHPPAVPGARLGGWSPRLGFLVLAAALLMAGLGWAWLAPYSAVTAAALVPMPSPAPVPQPSRTVAVVAPAVAGPVSAEKAEADLRPMPPPPRIARHRDPNGDQTSDLSDYVNEGETPTMGEVIARLRQAGVTSGLAAFSPPGTRPPLVGLAVPEDFVLPPGYVRHYQATDDGLRIEPILMFSPDLAPMDAAGQPMAIPADRLVPPELAPPGLPIRRIVVPAPVDPAGRRR